MPVGNRVFLKRENTPKHIVEQFKELPASNIADTMNRLCALSSEIRLFSRPEAPVMAGPALTVKVRPGDNLMLHQALNMAEPGDVIVVTNKGDRSQSLIGEIMAAYALHDRKVAGIVLDGNIRDVDAISEMNFHLYATGTTPGGPFKEGPGEVNVPIAIGGIVVHPGDLIVGDADGVIVVPRQDAEAVLALAKPYAAADHAKVVAAKNGTAKRAWVKESLDKKGADFIDDVYRA